MSAPSRSAYRLSLIVSLFLCCVVSGFSPASLRGAEATLKENTSLGFVPADAEAYYSLFRLGEMMRTLQESNAYAAIKEMPYYQIAMGGMQIAMQSNEDYGKFRGELAKPENQQLFKLLTEMASEEIFFYYGAGTSDLLKLSQEASSAGSIDSVISALIQGAAVGADGENDAEEILRKQQEEQLSNMLDTLIQNPQRLNVPAMVIGFRIHDHQAAEDQLVRAETLLRALLMEHQPEWVERLARVQVGNESYLEMKLDGTLVPWDELRKEMEGEEQPKVDQEKLEKLIEIVNKKTFVIDLGVRGDYLLLSFGSSHEHLKNLGKGKLLIDQTELALVREHAEKRLSSVVFVSEKMVTQAKTSQFDLGKIADSLQQALPKAELEDEIKEQAAKDLREFVKDFQGKPAKTGAMVSVDFYTNRGIEGFRHDWSEHPQLDGSQPLPILRHVGGHPWLLFAGRSPYRPQDYDLAVKWIKRIYFYSDKSARKELKTDKDKELYEKASAVVMPLLARLDKANRELLIPGMKDGQGAFLFDAKTASHQWHAAMPPSNEALPMIEPAIVCGVSDAEKVRQACQEYYRVFNDAIAAVRELSPEKLPEFKLPDPVLQEVPNGQIYGYPLPAEWDLDAQIVPNAGLNKTVAVLSLAPQHTRRLLIGEPLTIGGPLAKTDRPMAAVAHFHFAGLVEAIRPWIEYGVMMNGVIEHRDGFIAEEDVPAEGADKEPPPATTRGQIRTVLKVLSCFRGVTAVVTVEKGVTITHYETHYQDLPKPKK